MSLKSDFQSNNTDLQVILDTINNLPESVEQEAPTISVSSDGLITATAGDKSATKQLSTQGSKTITPTISSQTAVSSGKYTTGAVTVAGDSNLIPENIKSGVSIFGVTGTLTSQTMTKVAITNVSTLKDGTMVITIDGFKSTSVLKNIYLVLTTDIGTVMFAGVPDSTLIGFSVVGGTSAGIYRINNGTNQIETVSSVNFTTASINENSAQYCIAEFIP